MHPRSTGRASGTDYVVVTCDPYSAQPHGHLDCCSPAVVADLVRLMSRIQHCSLLRLHHRFNMKECSNKTACNIKTEIRHKTTEVNSNLAHRSRIRILRIFSFLKFNEFYEFFFR